MFEKDDEEESKKKQISTLASSMIDTEMSVSSEMSEIELKIAYENQKYW